jgi:hypothetical protein
MKHEIGKALAAHLAKLGRKGGKARAAKYDQATLSKWAKKGGRPPKKDKAK